MEKRILIQKLEKIKEIVESNISWADDDPDVQQEFIAIHNHIESLIFSIKEEE